MFGFLKKKEVFLCPVDGKILPISEVNDPVFSQEMMGPGFAVVPTSKVVVAPMDGDVVQYSLLHMPLGLSQRTVLR